MTTHRRRKSPLTGKYVTIPEEIVKGYEAYQKIAKRILKGKRKEVFQWETK